jgi:hypothetical protein
VQGRQPVPSNRQVVRSKKDSGTDKFIVGTWCEIADEHKERPTYIGMLIRQDMTVRRFDMSEADNLDLELGGREYHAATRDEVLVKGRI